MGDLEAEVAAAEERHRRAIDERISAELAHDNLQALHDKDQAWTVYASEADFAAEANSRYARVREALAAEAVAKGALNDTIARMNDERRREIQRVAEAAKSRADEMRRQKPVQAREKDPADDHGPVPGP